jgi:hypothetical protein
VNPDGGLLWGNGNPSISNDTVHLTTSGLPANTTVLIYQGTAPIAGGNGTVFGDGLRCAGGSVIRMFKRTALCGNREFGKDVPSDPLISVAGGVTTPGSRIYQVWYRNAAAYCTIDTFNFTNGYRIAWTP